MASWMVHLRVAQAPQRAVHRHTAGGHGLLCGLCRAGLRRLYCRKCVRPAHAGDALGAGRVQAQLQCGRLPHRLSGRKGARPKGACLLRGLLHPSADRPRMGARHRRACARGVGHLLRHAGGYCPDAGAEKKDWYGLDMQFLAENPVFEPLQVLAGAGGFLNEYLPYYGPHALAAQMKNIVAYYRTGTTRRGAYTAGSQSRAWTRSSAGMPAKYARFCTGFEPFRAHKGARNIFAPLINPLINGRYTSFHRAHSRLLRAPCPHGKKRSVLSCKPQRFPLPGHGRASLRTG